MRVLICGGRNFGNVTKLPDGSWEPATLRQYMFGTQWLITQFSDYLPDPETPDNMYGELTIIHGKAKGGDTIAQDFATNQWLKEEQYPADWEKHGKAAGHIRNQQMLDEGKPDIVVAFPGGRGTADMIRRAKAANIPVVEVEYQEPEPLT